VGEASYAAVPALVQIHKDGGVLDWNLFALVTCIETCRRSDDNPPMPGWLQPDYSAAWEDLFELGLEGLRRSSDPLLIRSILPVIAVHKGLQQLGELLAHLDGSEIEDLHQQYLGD